MRKVIMCTKPYKSPPLLQIKSVLFESCKKLTHLLKSCEKLTYFFQVCLKNYFLISFHIKSFNKVRACDLRWYHF